MPILLINICVSWVVIVDSPEYQLTQRFLKIIFIWLLPIFGASFVWFFRKADRAEIPNIHEIRKNNTWSEENEKNDLGGPGPY